MPRGGKRPGAGAPKGNLNALKHGRRSAQFAKLGALIAANESTREAMLDFARRLDVKQESAVKAIELHARIIEEARKIARGEPSPLEHVLRPETEAQSGRRVGVEGPHGLSVQSHDAERRSIVEDRSSAAPRKHDRPRRRENRRAHNQTARDARPNNQTPNTETAPKSIDRPSKSIGYPQVDA
jgi:hypothetical protein